MKYRLSKSAENDLKDIWDYTLGMWGDKQAVMYLTQLERRFIDLAKTPEKGRPRGEIDPRYFSYHEGRHLIFYRPLGNGIAIARVLHERMDIRGRIEDDPGFD